MSKKNNVISGDIKDKIDTKMGTSARDIIVHRNKEKVELSGCVNLLSEKKEAEYIAAGEKDVTNVKNTITIAIDGNISDKESAAEVNSKLRNSTYHDELKGVTAKVSSGTAILEGQASTQMYRKEALNEATKGLGIKDVVNHIDISTRSDDVSIANEINARYEMSRIDNQDLSSIVEYGLVTLQGFVNNKGEADNLVSIAEDIPGVKKVSSHLEIRDWNLN